MRKYFIPMVVVFVMMFTTTFAFAATDPNVTIVSPVSQSTITANNLLISVKLTQPKTSIRVNVYERKEMVGGVLKSINLDTLSETNIPDLEELKPVAVMTTAAFTCTNNLSFYTKQIDIKPGIYEVRVETVDSAGKVKYTSYSYVGVKENKENSELFETEQSGTFQFLQNVLKSIFKS